MKINEIAFTCNPVTDMPRARKFYEELFGLKSTMDHKMERDHWVEYDIGASMMFSA
jgi:predicted enzyme related to lactoylglutathione lyase